MTVLDLPLGVCAVISGFHRDMSFVNRLRAVGIYEGAEVTVLRRAPFRGALQIQTTYASVAIDASLAQQIHVRSCDSPHGESEKTL